MLCSRVLILLGSVFIYNQVVSGDMFVAELMVESNITLETSTIISTFNNTQLDFNTEQVSIQHVELVSDCLLLGETVQCDCGVGYIWSNEVCYNVSCCNDTTCTQPILDYQPMCIPKLKVQIVGTVELAVDTWDEAAELKLIAGLKKLNGFESLNLTTLQSDNIADFVANVSARFLTSKLQEVIEFLELDMSASILMESIGLVEMTASGSLVCYESTPVLTCTFNEVLSTTMWTMSRGAEFAELANGSVAELTTCESATMAACINLTLRKVTGIWAGVFKCEFSEGSVKHTALLGLNVALLPDPVTMLMTPLMVDCSEGGAASLPVIVTTIIEPSSENFVVTWAYRGVMQADLKPEVGETEWRYIFTIDISCASSPDAHYVNITFQNQKLQKKSIRMDIGVIYAGAPFCEEEFLDLSVWPRTPGGNSVFNRTCPVGRAGYVSRTCVGRVWQDTFFQCVSADMLQALGTADAFKQGFDATQSAAEGIFGTLNNGSIKSSGSKEDLADLSAGISILNTMAQASANVVLNDQLFPDLIGAASNMLNQSWEAVNMSIQNAMSTNYLESMEGLVENIQANNSKGVDSENVLLLICKPDEEDCSQTVFGVDVALNNSKGIIKTMGVKNLAHKLPNKNKQSKTASLVVSATLQNTSEAIDIQLNFPREHPEYDTVQCVFWNITSHQWSGEGCELVTSEDGNQTICECSHLTPFSALMSKTTLILPFLDELTYLGLGVSICSLLLFLIIEALVWSAVVKTNLSHFRHTSLVNIAVSLLLADLSFLASAFPSKISENMCLVFTICKHFFFLTMFCWMLCLSVMLVHQLIFVFNPLRKRVFMFLSSIVGYIVPMLIVGITYVYYKYTGSDYLKKETCWLTYEGLLRGSIHAFLLPVGIVVLTNLFSMFVVIITLTKTAVPDANKSDADTAKGILKVMLLLTPAFGLTWILGFVQLLLGDSSEEASIDGLTQSGLVIFIHYAFTILNTFQGLFLFITGVLAEQRVRDEVLKLIMAKTSSGEKSEKNTTNTSKN